MCAYAGMHVWNACVRMQNKLAAMENGQDCLFSASGMNACTTMLMVRVPSHLSVCSVASVRMRVCVYVGWGVRWDGEWGMGNGGWGMVNGEWGMGNGEWGMGMGR